MTDPASHRQLYGRRQGHKLRAGQAALVEELLPQLAVPETGPLTADALFGDPRPLEVEIGFGAGEHLAGQASARPETGFIGCEPFLNGMVGALGHVSERGLRNVRLYMGDALDVLEVEIGFGAGEHLAGQASARPETGFIGCEPFLNGMVGALGHISERGLQNVRLYMGDALDVLERLPDASLARVYLLHPDPWPKARHAKRRMVNDGPLDVIAAKLVNGGEFRLGTDDPTYCRHAMMVMARRGDFAWTARDAADFLTRPVDWPETRYERKARRQGHEVWYFRWIRI